MWLKMKILIILHKAKKQGGLSLQFLKMTKEFRKKDHDVKIFSYDSLEYINSPIIRAISIYRELKKTIVGFNPDIIFTSDPFITSIYPIIISKKKHSIILRIGADCHSFYAARFNEKLFGKANVSGLFYKMNKIILKFISKIILKKIDLVIFNSKFLKKKPYKGVENSTVIYNGVEFKGIKNIRIHDPIKLVYVGRIEPRKTLELIVNSVNLLKKKNISFHLSIIGNISDNPRYLKKLSKMISYYELKDRIKFLGEIENINLPKILQGHDILLFSTDNRNFPITEGLPNVILEGMANGLAIVATPVAGVPEIISPKNGFLAKPNPESFAEKIIRLIKEPHLLLKIKKANVEEVKNNYTIAGTSNGYLRVFQYIIEKEIYCRGDKNTNNKTMY
ncbi:MAG: glycosyltransferase [Candidatus Heimdallarchaeota archaeon]|nr:glycosyltransferase [Candidatus Heimdallarchaeota archaeon]